MGRTGPRGRRQPPVVQTPAGDRVHPAEPRQGSDARRACGRCLHESLPLRASLQVQHRGAASPIRGPTTDRPRPRVPGHAGAVDRADLAEGGIPDPESLRHSVPARSGHHAGSIPSRSTARRPARPGRRGEMNSTEIVAERSYQEASSVEQRPLFPRKAIDRDAALVDQLRRADAGAAEALVATYGDRVYRLALRITGNASDAEEVVQDALWTASRKIDTFRGTAAFGSWVYRITANAAYQKLRG